MEQRDRTSIPTKAVDPISILDYLESLNLNSDEPTEDRREKIEREANFVDQFILKIDQQGGWMAVLEQSATPDFFLSMLTPEFGKKLCGLKTPQDRVEFALKYFRGVHIQPEILRKYQKNAETSQQLRDHGNDLFRRKKFKDALHYYNLSLMFSDAETENFGMACANRSAVLIELGHFEDAIGDIELALKNKYPEARIQKLLERRIRCHDLIRKKQEEYFALDSQVRKEAEEEMQKMNEMLDEMLTLKKPNPRIPAAAEFVEIKLDPVLGRELVVNRDVGPGTVVLVEEPFIFTLHGWSNWHTDHCHHCLKHIWRGIPCGNCVFAIYCSELCRMEATRIHHYECKCLPSFHCGSGVDHHFTAFRVILKVGPNELFRLFENKDPQYFQPARPFGTDPNCVYDSKAYLPVFHLMRHSEKLGIVKRAVNPHAALIAVSVFENNTDFFEDIPAERKPTFKNFVAALILRHIEAEVINAPSITEVEGLENVAFVDSYSGKLSRKKFETVANSLKFWKFADALYPLFSLMNHSCDPNVSYLNHTTNGTMIVVTHRVLKAGEPLLISYTKNFFVAEIGARQAELEGRYQFQCRCIACKMNWPTMLELDTNPRFCCPACSKEVFEYEKGSTEFKKCLLAAPSWKCGKCGRIYSEATLNFRLKVVDGLMMEFFRNFYLNRPRKAYDLYLKIVDFHQFNIFPPNGQLYAIQVHFRIALAILLYYAQ